MGDQNNLSFEMEMLKMKSSEIKENFHEITSTTKTSSATIVQNEVVKQEANNEKKNIDEQPREPKNWNDLPNELKLNVIENCDFKARIHVAMTCRQENALVGRAKPITWEWLRIDIGKDQISIKTNAGCVEHVQKFDVNSDDSLRNLMNALIFVLKSEVKNFEISYQRGAESVLPQWFHDELRKHGSFNFRNFQVFFPLKCTRNYKLSNVFIEHRGLPLERLQCNMFYGTPNSFYDFIDRIYMNTCRELRQAVSLDADEELHKVITHVLKNWIDKDVPIGTRFLIMNISRFSRAYCQMDPMLNNLNSTLNLENSQFLLRGEQDEVRTMNGKPKTILIGIDENYICQNVNIEVIPTELRPSEYKEFRFWS